MSKRKNVPAKNAAPPAVNSPASSKFVSPLFSKTDWGFITLIIVAVFFSFCPTFKNGFVDWDDTGMFLQNFNYRGLAWPNIQWMFTTTHYAHYHPITWLTLGLDYKIWGMNPLGYHLGNLIFHAANGVLFYLITKAFLQRQTFTAQLNSLSLGAACTIGALFFAIHPLRVESVAWATERRDVVSGFFYLLTLLVYLRAEAHPAHRQRWLTLALLCFVFSFLSKAWGITLPVVLLVLDYYPLQKIQSIETAKRAVIEKIPFFLVSVGLAVVAYLGQAQWGIKAANFSLAKRIMNAAYGLVFYPAKTLLPLHLSPIYPLDPNFNPAELKYAACLIAGAIITISLFLLRKRAPWALAAWLCYAVIVSPVLGIAQSGEQIAADRYTYLSCLPFALLTGLAAAWLLSTILKSASSQIIFSTASIALFVTLGLLTFRQTKIWHDDLSLWNQALAADSENFIAYNGRGKLHLDRQEWDAAIADFNQAIRLNPKRVAPYTNRGYAYYYQKNLTAALADFNQSLDLEPEHETYNNRGALREVQGDIDGALHDYDASIQLVPNVSALSNRARLREQRGNLKGAFFDYTMALRVDPSNASMYHKRGKLRLSKNDFAGAIRDFTNALQVAPPHWPERPDIEQQLTQLKNQH